MRIDRLELFGYTRLLLNNIQHLIYTPEQPFQLILGTNGSGKSSLLYELSPLPAVAANYTKEGYKDIRITHRGSQYHLVSAFKHGNKHSFVKDGEELNPGGTGHVQKELVKQEFGYSQDLHEILIGDVRFTDMPPMKRREWLTQLSTEDYTYALGLYNKLKSLARDNQGTLKHLKQRLTAETNNLRALDDVAGLEERAALLREELNLLLTARTPNIAQLNIVEQQLADVVQQVGALSRQILTTPTVTLTNGARSLEEVGEHLNALEGQVNTTQALLNRSTTEYAELETMVKDLGMSAEEIPENIDGLILETEYQLDLVSKARELFTTLVDGAAIQRESQQALDQVMELFGKLPDNSDRRWSQEAIDRVRGEIAQYNRATDQSNFRLRQINERLAMIRAAKDTTCPDCGYIWREGFSENEIAELEGWREQHAQILTDNEAAVKERTAFLEEADHVASLYRQARGLTASYPRLRPLWDHILQNNLLFNNPRDQQWLFHTWQRDVDRQVEIDKLQDRISQLKNLSAMQGHYGGVQQLLGRLSSIEREIEESTQQLQERQRAAQEVRRNRDSLQRLMANGARLETLSGKLSELQDTAIVALRNQQIDKVVSTHQNELALIQRRLMDKHALEGIVADLTRSHDEVALDHEAFSAMARELSPTEGMIAEQLAAFIRCLTDQLNSIIASIWTYDLVVQPCGMDSGELDYKFPLHADVADRPSPDISKTSKGQQQVVNFAFVLTVMLYLNLQDYPLYLDEPGEGFDEQHRVNLMNFVKQLMDVQQHSQLFMISHYASSHGAFTTAEVMVLDSSNIAIPGEHNQHVVMA